MKIAAIIFSVFSSFIFSSIALADVSCPANWSPTGSVIPIQVDSGSTYDASGVMRACGKAGANAAKWALADAKYYCSNAPVQMVNTANEPAAGGASPSTLPIGGNSIPNNVCHCQSFGSAWLCGNVQRWDVRCCAYTP